MTRSCVSSFNELCIHTSIIAAMALPCSKAQACLFAMQRPMQHSAATLTAARPLLLCAGSSSAAAAAAPGGSRLQDELVITLNKALAQANPGYKRIGIMGMLALLQQEGATYELLSDAEGTAAGVEQQQSLPPFAWGCSMSRWYDALMSR